MGKAELTGQVVPDEDDEDEDSGEEETEFRKTCVEMIGAVMKVQPRSFQGEVLTGVGQKIQLWIQSKENRTLALYLACEVVEQLKEASTPIWQCFMNQVFSTLDDTKDHDAVLGAVYCINVASTVVA